MSLLPVLHVETSLAGVFLFLTLAVKNMTCTFLSFLLQCILLIRFREKSFDLVHRKIQYTGWTKII